MLAGEQKIGVFLYHKEKRMSETPGSEDLKKLAASFPGVEVVEDLFEDHWETSAVRLEQEIRSHDLSRLVIVLLRPGYGPVRFSKRGESTGP